MSRLEAWLVHLSTLLVGVTGLLYAWVKYVLGPVSSYSVVGSAWRPTVEHLHLLAAPLLVFAMGLIWRRHAWSQFRRRIRRRRSSGLVLLVMLAPMIVSGYLLQTTSRSEWHRAWVWVHLGTSVLWLGAYVAHQLTVVGAERE